MGKGQGHGMGVGSGQGRGKGKDNTSNVMAGGMVTIVFTVCMCVIGIPALIAGGVLMWLGSFGGNVLYDAGLAILIISILLTVGGLILIILICSGVLSKGKNRQSVQPGMVLAGGRTTVVVANSYGQPQAPPGYSQAAHGQPVQPGHPHQAPPPGYGPPPAYPNSGQPPPPGNYGEPGGSAYPPEVAYPPQAGSSYPGDTDPATNPKS